jgi:DNA invertase Pin-like site-specific DNA recombinase
VVKPVPASDRKIQKRLNGSSVLAKAKADGKFMGRKPTAFEKSEEVGRLATEGMNSTDIGRSASVALRSTVSWGPSQNMPSK